jgi:adenylate kinase family enzyme
MNSLKTYIFIGRSGSGKGTQAKLLEEALKKINPETPVFYHETGGAFRTFIEGSTYTQKKSRKVMENGGLQPSFLAVLMWGNIFVEKITGTEHIILDGTPRYLEEAKILDSALSFYERDASIVYVDISREEAMKRLAIRGREDDKELSDVEERMKWFETAVLPAIHYYRNHDKHKLFTVSGEKDILQVHNDIMNQLGLG